MKRVGNLSERKSKKLIQLWSNFFLQTFVGNKDAESVVINQVEPSFEAVCVRLHPQSWHRWISMRVELFGCPGNKIILPAIFSNHQSPSTRVKSKSFSLRIFLCVVPPKTALGYIFAGVSQKVEDVNRKVAHKRKFV